MKRDRRDSRDLLKRKLKLIELGRRLFYNKKTIRRLLGRRS